MMLQFYFMQWSNFIFSAHPCKTDNAFIVRAKLCKKVRNSILFFVKQKISHFYKSGLRTQVLLSQKAFHSNFFIVFLCKQKKCKFSIKAKIEFSNLCCILLRNRSLQCHYLQMGTKASWYICLDQTLSLSKKYLKKK